MTARTEAARREIRWRIELLGWLRAHVSPSETISSAGRVDLVIRRFRRQKTGLLLAYLAYHRRRSHPRKVLIELLWPECDPAVGRNRLRVALTSLRQQFEPPGVSPGTVIVADRETVQLNPDACTTDVAEFEQQLRLAVRGEGQERIDHLTEAVQLYQGEFLPGAYDEWVLAERQFLAEAFQGALSQLVAGLEQVGELPQAVQWAQRAVAADPLREEARRTLIRLCAASGEPAAAFHQQSELERLLRRELGAASQAAIRGAARNPKGSNPQCEEAASASPVAPAGPDREAPHLARARPSAQPSDEGALSGDWKPSTHPHEIAEVERAVPLGSPFYVIRETDRELRAAIRRRDSVILLKGARQMGKTSLLARGLQQARESGARVVLTDFQVLGPTELASAAGFFRALAEWLADQLDAAPPPEQVWKPHLGAVVNFERYVSRELLGRSATSLVWGLDEVDHLFPYDAGSQLFRLFRSWHDRRRLEPDGRWDRLTLAIAYATEAHLFIADLNQSPFNVGTRLDLAEFTREEVADLNRRHGSPLRDRAEVDRFQQLLSGHPYLVNGGLHGMVRQGLTIGAFESAADHEEGVFGDHLRRLLLLVRDPSMGDAVRQVLLGHPCPDSGRFYRLRSAGVIAGESAATARLRCELYARYLRRHLLPSAAGSR